MLVYLDGRFIPAEQAMVSVFDHGFLYGDGIYETMRAYGGRIFLLDKHLSRLKRSAEAIGLHLPLTLEANRGCPRGVSHGQQAARRIYPDPGVPRSGRDRP